MAANKIVNFGTVALTTTLTTNILNPGTATGGVGGSISGSGLYFIVRHVRIVNTTAGAVTFTLAIGATGATPSSANAFMGFGTSIPANSYVDWYGQLRLTTADFVVGGASANSSLTIQAEGEVGIA